MSESMQIEIPSFDEDEDYSNVITPMPHAHARPFFDPNSPMPGQGSFQAPPSGGADDSPSGPSRHFTTRHARADSTSSETSVISLGFRSVKNGSMGGGSSGLGHAPAPPAKAQPNTNTLSKKSSFGALKAAMKSVRAFAEAAERVPPVPTLNLNKEKEKDTYPELRNPFAKQTREPNTPGRSQSPALSMKSTSKKRPTLSTMRSRPSQQSNGTNASASTSTSTRNASSSNWGLTHSASSSWAYDSDFSEFTREAREQDVPPVPKLPRSVGGQAKTAAVGVDEAVGLGAAAVENEPKTPGELALHVIFTQFVAKVEEKIRRVLDVTLDKDPSVPSVFGPNVDSSLDSLLVSLGHIAQRHANLVVEALMRWRRTQREPISQDQAEKQRSTSPKSRTLQEAKSILTQRKQLASIYVFSRTLLVLVRTIGKDSVPEALAMHLENTIFNEFRDLDPRSLSQSSNWKAVSSLYAELLGAMAESRFLSVTDHFLDALGSMSNEQVLPDMETRYTHVLKGMKHVKIKVWPPEAFEEGAEFMDALAGNFANAHGFPIKTAFAEALTHMMHPVRKTAGAEVNHPLWAKAIQSIYPRAFALMAKPRYWYSAFPLTITSLCLAPTEFFLKHWMSCFDLCTAKLKDKTARLHAMSGICRLLWTYLYRCHEPASTAVKVLEGCMRSIVPPNRPLPLTSDEPLDCFVYMLHMACSRHFEFGRDLILDCLHEQHLSLSSGQTGVLSSLPAPEKMTIALRAAIATLRGLDTDSGPSWPTSSDFASWDTGDDHPAWNGTLSDATLAKPGVGDFVERLSPLVTKVVTACDRLVGRMFVSDDNYSYSQQAPSYEEREYLVVRQNGSRMVAYRKDLALPMDLLRACFDAWPTLWSRSSKLSSTLCLLIDGVAHVNPLLGQAATDSLQRFACGVGDETGVILNITRWLFASEAILKTDTGLDLMCEHVPMLELWVLLIKNWSERAITVEGGSLEQSPSKPDAISQLVGHIEAGALFLICSTKLQIRELGLKVLRVVVELPDAYQPEAREAPFRLIRVLEGSIAQAEYLRESERSLNLVDEERVRKWLARGFGRNLAKLIEDDNSDRFLWRMAFPPFLRICMDRRPRLIATFRSSLAAAVSRIHSIVSGHAGISTKNVMSQAKSPMSQISFNDSAQAAVQWVSWVLSLSATAVPTDSGPPAKEHNRHGSDPVPLQERILTNRGLIRLILPYLDADTRALREGMVYALGCIHPTSLRAVLEDAGSVVRNIHIEARTALSQRRAMQRSREQDRLHTSVMHVFQLTSDLPKRMLIDRDQIVELLLSFYQGSVAFFRDAVSRKDLTLLPLRKHFCGLVEQLYDVLLLDGPWNKPDGDTMLWTYRYCEEWCDYAYPVQQTEGLLVRALSDTATRAIASLTSHRSLFAAPPVAPKGHVTLRPLTYPDVFRWIEDMLPLSYLTARTSAKRALKLICDHSMSDDRMSTSLVGFCLPANRHPGVAAIFFDIVSDKLLDDTTVLRPSRLLFLCLSNITHPEVLCRRKALGCLESLLHASERQSTLAAFRSAMEVAPEGSHVQAQRAVSRALVAALPEQAIPFLAECAGRFSEGYSDGGNSMLVILEPWMEYINFVVPEGGDSGLQARALAHLLSISAVHLLTFADEVRALWQRLVCGRFPGNHRAVIRLCILHAVRCGREDYIRIVQAGISAFAMTSIAIDAFSFLCDWIAVQTIVPSKMDDPSVAATENGSELDSLFPPSGDTVKLSSGQAACLFLSDLALPDATEITKRLPLLIHALMNLVDHEQALIRTDAHLLLIRILRLCIPRDSVYGSGSIAVEAIEQSLRNDSPHFIWTTDNQQQRPDPRTLVDPLCHQVLDLLGKTLPTARQLWRDVALDWSIVTSSRQVAIRSLQILCVLQIELDYNTLALLLGRLSNIASDNMEQGNNVAHEILRGLVSMSSSVTVDQLVNHPQLLWTGFACLNSTAKQEFHQGVQMLDNLFKRLEESDSNSLVFCLSATPEAWSGSEHSLLQLLTPGLRSSDTSEATFKLIERLARNPAARFFEDDDLHGVITVSLPRFLETMDDNQSSTAMHSKDFAMSLAAIAEAAEWHGMVRVLTSLVKDRFRNREDFIRQVIGCLRERIPGGGWLETITLLLGMVFNSHRQTRINTMSILKQLFSMPDIRGQLRYFGSEHLTPLLRLLSTDLASQALEVLDEPMSVSGGMSARQVVRMSLINGPALRKQDERPPGVIFGVPDASGWCVARPDTTRVICRQNVTALYDVCNTKRIEIARTSGVDLFGQENISDPAHYGRPESVSGYNDDEGDDSFGDLVSTLHDLSNYFEEDDDDDEDDTLPMSASLANMQDAESRVAAILFRSFHNGNLEGTPTSHPNGMPPYGGDLDDPPTPFLDLFSLEPLP